MSSAQNNKASNATTFTVEIKDMTGKSVSIEGCHSDTTILDLITQLRQTLPKIKQRQEIQLVMQDSSILEPSDTLGNKGINGNTLLDVFYTGEPSCINQDSITNHLHHWIEGQRVEFQPPFNYVPNAMRYVADGTEIVLEHNKWLKDEKYLFFLTDTQNKQLRDPQLFESNHGTISYKSGLSDLTRPLSVQYFPNGKGSPPTKAPIDNYSSIRGTLEGIKIVINQHGGVYSSELGKYVEGYTRSYYIHVILKGPIEICNSKGRIIANSDQPDALCFVPYDNIVICDSDGKLSIPNQNNSQTNYSRYGGRRTKRSKRSQKKRKTRRTHKKRT